MRILISAVISAVALFFFGFLWWGVLMPVVRPVEVLDGQELVDQVTALPESGVYMYPNYLKPEPDAGDLPVAMIYFKKSVSMGGMMGAGILHMFICSALVAALVARLNLPVFSSRFGYVFAMGLFLAIWADWGNMIWWQHPPVWAAYHFTYDLISWTIAGLIIAAIIKPTPAEA
ncbi:MAG: hypothetical protein Aurels2KO_00880 [Aureliella sp.]